MAQSKASPDSTRTSSPEKPFVRLDDIGNTGLILGIIIGVLIFGSFIVFTVLFKDDAHLPHRFVTFYFRSSICWIWGSELRARAAKIRTTLVCNWTNIR